jgi:hypothetical protein
MTHVPSPIVSLLHRLRSNSRLRRWLLLRTYILVLIAVAAIACVLTGTVLSSKASLSDRLAEAGDVLAGGTLALALLAGLVALQAYASATGLPDLKLQILFGISDLNELMFEIELVEEQVMAAGVGGG